MISPKGLVYDEAFVPDFVGRHRFNADRLRAFTRTAPGAPTGASIISNSYGGCESTYDPNFDQRGKAIVVAAGSRSLNPVTKPRHGIEAF